MGVEWGAPEGRGVGYRLGGQHIAHRGWDIHVGGVVVGKVEPLGRGHLGVVCEGPLEVCGGRGGGRGVRDGGGCWLLLGLQGQLLGKARAFVVGQAGEEALAEFVQETLFGLDGTDGGDEMLFPVSRCTVVGVDVGGGGELEVGDDGRVVGEREEGERGYFVGQPYGVTAGLLKNGSGRKTSTELAMYPVPDDEGDGTFESLFELGLAVVVLGRGRFHCVYTRLEKRLLEWSEVVYAVDLDGHLVDMVGCEWLVG